MAELNGEWHDPTRYDYGFETDYYRHHDQCQIRPMSHNEISNLDLFGDLDSLFTMGCGGNYLN